MAADLPEFEPRIIEYYVARTYRKATAILLGSVTAGVTIGAVVGALPLTSLGAGWPIPRMFGFATMLGGALIGGVIGYTIGDTRAFLCRLQGQTALAQVSAAKNATAALAAVQEIQAVLARRPVEPTPAPVAPAPTVASAPAPAPVAVAEPQPEGLAPAEAPPKLRVAVGADVPLPPVTP